MNYKEDVWLCARPGLGGRVVCLELEVPHIHIRRCYASSYNNNNGLRKMWKLLVFVVCPGIRIIHEVALLQLALFHNESMLFFLLVLTFVTPDGGRRTEAKAFVTFFVRIWSYDGLVAASGCGSRRLPPVVERLLRKYWISCQGRVTGGGPSAQEFGKGLHCKRNVF